MRLTITAKIRMENPSDISSITLNIIGMQYRMPLSLICLSGFIEYSQWGILSRKKCDRNAKSIPSRGFWNPEATAAPTRICGASSIVINYTIEELPKLVKFAKLQLWQRNFI